VGLSIYSAAKAAVINLTQALAVELAPRMNAVAPGVAKTKIGNSLLGIGEEEFAKRYTLLGRIVTPEDVAEAVWMLVKIPTVTGQVVVVDSGQLLWAALVRHPEKSITCLSHKSSTLMYILLMASAHSSCVDSAHSLYKAVAAKVPI
jgi:hypothetical protein